MAEALSKTTNKPTVAGVAYQPTPAPVEAATAEYRLVVVIDRVDGGWNAASPMLPGVSCGGNSWREAYTDFASGVGLIRNNHGDPKPLAVVDVDEKDIPKPSPTRVVRVLAIS